MWRFISIFILFLGASQFACSNSQVKLTLIADWSTLDEFLRTTLFFIPKPSRRRCHGSFPADSPRLFYGS